MCGRDPGLILSAYDIVKLVNEGSLQGWKRKHLSKDEPYIALVVDLAGTSYGGVTPDTRSPIGSLPTMLIGMVGMSACLLCSQ